MIAFRSLKTKQDKQLYNVDIKLYKIDEYI